MTKKVKVNKNIKKEADEFKKFISRGSVVDMAIGVIIGGAFGKIVSSLKMEDEPFTTALYGKRLADFCTGEMVFKTIYDKETDDRRIIKGKITTEELEENAKQYIMRYRSVAQPINEVIDDIEILKASPKKEEDYSLYESVTALTATALDKISGENKITVENYLLKSLATSKKILEPKSRNSEFIAKVKKLYKK